MKILVELLCQQSMLCMVPVCTNISFCGLNNTGPQQNGSILVNTCITCGQLLQVQTRSADHYRNNRCEVWPAAGHGSSFPVCCWLATLCLLLSLYTGSKCVVVVPSCLPGINPCHILQKCIIIGGNWTTKMSCRGEAGNGNTGSEIERAEDLWSWWPWSGEQQSPRLAWSSPRNQRT